MFTAAQLIPEIIIYTVDVYIRVHCHLTHLCSEPLKNFFLIV